MGCILIPNFEFICIFFRGKDTLRYVLSLSSFPSILSEISADAVSDGRILSFGANVCSEGFFIVLIDGRLATSPMVLNCAKLAIGTNADVSITSIDFFMVQS